MKLQTKRIEEYKPTKPTNSHCISASQEYRVLATLKTFFPRKFKLAYKSERPDIKTDSLGVEVTLICNPKEKEIESIFGNAKKRAEKLKEKTRKEGLYIIEEAGIPILRKGGGFDSENYKKYVEKAIQLKLQKSNEYVDEFGSNLELVILQEDLIPSEVEKNVAKWMLEIAGKNCIFKKIYYICSNYIIRADTANEHIWKRKITAEQNMAFKIIGRMTAEGNLDMDSPEWN